MYEQPERDHGETQFIGPIAQDHLRKFASKSQSDKELPYFIYLSFVKTKLLCIL